MGLMVIPETVDLLKKRAEEMIRTNPIYKAAMYESLRDLLVCLAEKV